MDTSILEDIGLTHGEIKVYLALLESGETSAGPIKKKLHIQNSVVHLCLGNLIQKGLVSYIEKGKRNFYTAIDPKHLIDFIEEKKRRLQELIPELTQKQKSMPQYQVHIYEGSKGLKSVYEDMYNELGKGEEFLLLGAPKEAHEQFEAYFLDFHKRRIKKGIQLRGLYKKETEEYVKVREKMPFTQARYLPDKITTPMWIIIYKNTSIIYIAKDLLLGIVIENETVAQNFREYFEFMWNIS